MNIYRSTLIAAVMFCSTAHSLNLRLDANELPVSRQNITLKIGTGDVIVETDNAVTECVPGDTQAPSLVLFADPETVTQGGNTFIHWQTGGATSCDAWGGGNTGFANLNPPLPSGSFYAENIQSNTEFGMTCNNSNGAASDSITISVDGGNTGGNDQYPGDGVFPQGCSTNPTPGTTWQNSHYLWADTFGTWPGIGLSEQWWITTRKWTAMYFETENTAYSFGKIRFNEAAASGPRGNRPKMIKISSCPGDFADDVTGQACRFDGPTTNGHVYWESGDIAGGGDPNRCTLGRNKGYYLNVIFGVPSSPSITTCRDQSSGTVWPECELLMVPDPN